MSDAVEGVPQVGEPPAHAAGVAAVASAMRHGVAEMGVRRTAQTLSRVNQHDGFDCPGCAWPEGGHRHRAEFCENGAKAVAEEATRRRATPDLFARFSIDELAERPDFWIGKQGRLTQPLHRAPGDTHYRPIGWDEAFGVIAQHLQALDHPDQAAFYTSGRTSNEAAFAYRGRRSTG